MKDLHSLPPFAGLDGALLAELDAMSRPARLARDDVLYPAGKGTDAVGYVVSGVLRMRKTLVDGKQQIVGLLVEGDIFGRVFDGPMPFSIEAASDCDIILFDKHEFESLVERNPDLERLVILGLLNELDSAREWLGLLCNHRATERVAGFLLFLHRRWTFMQENRLCEDGVTVIDIPIKRRDLAQVLGTRPEALSRAIHALENDGVIEIVTPYRLRVLDCDALAHLSGHDLTEDDVAAHLHAR